MPPSSECQVKCCSTETPKYTLSQNTVNNLDEHRRRNFISYWSEMADDILQEELFEKPSLQNRKMLLSSIKLSQ
jgi:hypothetical protein